MATSVIRNADEIVGERWQGFGRRFIYRPAVLWLSWLFIMSLATIVFIIVIGYKMWDAFKPSQSVMLALAPYFLAALLPALFGPAYATLQYTIARGFFVQLGDAGIYHVNQLTPLGVLVTKDEFEASMDPEFSKAVTLPDKSIVDYTGKIVTRFKVRMWGRLGGVKNWPGWDGGKKDGYYDVVYDYWDEIDGKIVRGRDYSPEELDGLKNVTPGIRMGTSMILPYEAWPCDFDEIPEEVALAVRSDPEYRTSSRVWEMEDLLPGRISLGSTVPSNTLVTSWAKERTNRMLRDRLMEATMQLALMRQMQEEGFGPSPPMGGMNYGGAGRP